MTKLTDLFEALAKAFDGSEEIEAIAKKALIQAASVAEYDGPFKPLPEVFDEAMVAPDAHPSCAVLRKAKLPWAPTQTIDDLLYAKHSLPKVHVELLGPEGLVRSDVVRLGVYGMLPGHEYGLRTHPAEEVFVMLAGKADWARGEERYQQLGPGERSYHPSMMPHASRTREYAFMSVYAWVGDLARTDYVYHGLPSD